MTWTCRWCGSWLLRTNLFGQFPKMVVFHALDLVRQQNKAPIDIVKLPPVKLIPQLLVTLAERMASGVFAQNQCGIWHTHRLRRDDLVSQWIFDHAILMNAGSMGKSIEPNNGFIRLDGNAGNFTQHLAGGIKLLGNYSGFVGILVGAYFQRHNYFFQGSVPGTFANSIDGALDLPRTSFHCGQRVSYRHSKIVMTMRGKYYPVPYSSYSLS